MKKNTFILLGILISHLIFVILSMNQPLHGDEAVFSESAKAILEKGAPVFDYGRLNPGFQGLWHTPLYIYILSSFIFAFGENIYALRAVSAVFNFLTIILIYLISREIFKNSKNKEFFSLVAVFLYALNPLAIQSSVVIDIDGGLLNFAIYLFLYLFVKNKSAWFVPSLVLVAFSKESGLAVLFASIIILFLMHKDWKKMLYFAGLFLIAGLVFIAGFFVYSHFLGLDFSMPFKHNIPFLREKTFDVSFLASLMTKAWSFKTFFYFAVPFFVGLFFILTFSFYYKQIKSRKLEGKNILLLNIFPLVTILMFFYLGASGWGFPKYYITALPAMSIFVSYMLKNFEFSWDRKKILLFFMLSAVLIFYFLSFLAFPLMPEFDSTSKNADIIQAGLLVFKSFLLYAVIPLALCFLVFKAVKFEKAFILALLFLAIFSCIYINSMHSLADYSTYYTYGDKGVLEVVSYFKNRGIEAGKIAAYPNIGSYLGMNEYTEITFLYNNPDEFKENIIDSKNIMYIVIYQRDIGRIGKNMDYFVLEKKIGTYYIYKKV